MNDPSNGYDAIAAPFAASRESRPIGIGHVTSWASRFAPGSAILDLGCGTGLPIARSLSAAGLHVFGVDASPAMVAAFRTNVPEAAVVCEPVETSAFFDRSFDGVIAWGLLFLLPAEVQTGLIARVARVVKPGGSFLFTAPSVPCHWNDVLTGQTSESLGADGYAAALDAAGLTLLREYEDEGENHYYEAELGERSRTADGSAR
ncbi:MAG: class I SAM-dependent methyltransferase [Thermoanaerobaculia bacterium]